MLEIGKDLGFTYEKRPCTCPYCHKTYIPKFQSEEWISYIEPVEDDFDGILPNTGRKFDVVNYFFECRNCNRIYNLLYSYTDDYDFYDRTGDKELILIEKLPQDYVISNQLNSEISWELGHELLGVKFGGNISFTDIRNALKNTINNLFYR